MPANPEDIGRQIETVNATDSTAKRYIKNKSSLNGKKTLGSDSMNQWHVWPSGSIRHTMTNSRRKQQHCSISIATQSSSNSRSGSSPFYAYTRRFAPRATLAQEGKIEILCEAGRGPRLIVGTYWRLENAKIPAMLHENNPDATCVSIPLMCLVSCCACHVYTSQSRSLCDYRAFVSGVKNRL